MLKYIVLTGDTAYGIFDTFNIAESYAQELAQEYFENDSEYEDLDFDEEMDNGDLIEIADGEISVEKNKWIVVRLLINE